MKYSVELIVRLILVVALAFAGSRISLRMNEMRNQWPTGSVVTNYRGEVGMVLRVSLNEVQVRFGSGDARWYRPIELTPVRKVELEGAE